MLRHQLRQIFAIMHNGYLSSILTLCNSSISKATQERYVFSTDSYKSTVVKFVKQSDDAENIVDTSESDYVIDERALRERDAFTSKHVR